jgi:hypothetical protein
LKFKTFIYSKILAAKKKFLGLTEDNDKDDLLTTNKMTIEIHNLIEEMNKPKAGLEKNIRGSKRFSVEPTNTRDVEVKYIFIINV